VFEFVSARQNILAGAANQIRDDGVFLALKRLGEITPFCDGHHSQLVSKSVKLLLWTNLPSSLHSPAGFNDSLAGFYW
jgi:hypothetical protein